MCDKWLDMETGILWIIFESGEYEGQRWLPVSDLVQKIKNPESLILEYLKSLPKEAGYDQEILEFFKSYDPKTTEFWTYDDLGFLCGSKGYCIIRKSYPPFKVVDSWAISRA